MNNEKGELETGSDPEGWREDFRMNPNEVKDDSTKGNYKNMWNRAKFQSKSDAEAY